MNSATPQPRTGRALTPGAATRSRHLLALSAAALILHSPFSILNSSASVPLRWTVETSRLQPAVFDVVHGESIELEAAMQSYGNPLSMAGKSVSIFWQTNGMDNAWWSAPAFVRTGRAPTPGAATPTNVLAATFTPAMDPDSPTVTGFLGATGDIYRASFTLRFRKGPGATPNVIEQPPPILDLARTVVINPPWPTQADFAATTTVMKAELKTYVDNATNATLTAVAGKYRTRTNLSYHVETPWTFTTQHPLDPEIANTLSIIYNDDPDTANGIGWYVTTDGYICSIGKGSSQSTELEWSRSEWGWVETDNAGSITFRRTYVDDSIALKNDSDARYAPTSTAVTVASHTSQLSHLSQSVASKADTATVSQLSQSVNGMQSSISTLNNGYTRLYNFATGATNANFSATNYPPTAAAAATRCHYQPEQGMDFSTVPASLQLNEYRDGAWRTVMDTRDWTVWYYRFKEIQLTNEIARLKAQNAVISNNLEIAKAWANHTANGVENPMTDTLVVDRPNMWLMADYEWQKCVSGSNQCFVLRAKNVALSGGANTNGFLEICDALGKPYMRINKSSETFAEPVFSNITYSVEEGAWYVVFGNAAKPTTGGANAEIVGNGTGKCILYAEDDPECPATITWPESADSHAGHWIMKAVPKPVGGVVPSKMFFGAEIKVAGKDYVEYVKEASFGAGIRVGNNVYEAVESGNTLIWTKRND